MLFLLLPRIQFSMTSMSATVVWAAHAADSTVLFQLVGMRLCTMGVQLTSVRLAVPWRWQPIVVGMPLWAPTIDLDMWIDFIYSMVR